MSGPFYIPFPQKLDRAGGGGGGQLARRVFRKCTQARQDSEGEVLVNQHFAFCLCGMFCRRSRLRQREFFANIEAGAA